MALVPELIPAQSLRWAFPAMPAVFLSPVPVALGLALALAPALALVPVPMGHHRQLAPVKV